MDAGKSTDKTEVVSTEKVATVEEDMTMIWIDPTNPGTVLIIEIFLGISAVLIEMLFRDTAKHMLAFKAAAKRMVTAKITTINVG